MGFLSAKKLLLAGFIFILLVGIPLTVYFSQQQQQTQTHAAPATKLSLSPTTQSKNVNDDVNLDVMIDPGANQVSFVKLDLSYDSTKLATNSAGTTCNQALCPTDDFPVTLEGPLYGAGTISITLSIGPNPTKVIQSPKKVATLKFKALATTPSDGTPIAFGTQTQVLSLASTDQVGENVLLPNSSPAKVVIGQGTTTLTPTPTSAPAQAPVCASLNLDRTATGSAPYSLTFTATGSDPIGTISKVTFDFGDGPIQDVTQGSGIGTKTVSVPIAHTYNNAGAFKASSILTNNNGATSSPATCVQNITISQGSGSATLTPTPAIVVATPTPIVATPTQAPIVITSPGPGNIIVGAGVAGIVLAVIGSVLFFAL